MVPDVHHGAICRWTSALLGHVEHRVDCAAKVALFTPPVLREQMARDAQEKAAAKAKAGS